MNKIARKTRPPTPRIVTLTEATEIARKHFSCICAGGIVTFSVLASMDDPRMPFIAIRCREHCFLEPQSRVHDVTVNRDGTIRSTKYVGIDGQGMLPGFTAN